jgi:2-iminoacetate synthase
LWNEDLEISSTHENEKFRDNIFQLGLLVSAGSKTNPGGYVVDPHLEQFEISDERRLQRLQKSFPVRI